MEKVYDMIVVGGGPGGYTTALYAARAGLSVLVLEKLSAGGQMALTHEIDNYPGFHEGIDGFELGQRMLQGAVRFGAENKYAQVLSLDLISSPKVVHSDSGDFLGRTVVVATGAEPRLLGLDREAELTGKGVHYCASCDGMFYRGKTVVLVGGGNSAAAEALVLSRIAKQVILVHRRDSLRAEKASAEAVEHSENIKILWNSQVTQLLHGGQMRGVVVEDLVTGESQELACDGVFISIGRIPSTELVRDQLLLDDAGYLMAGEDTKTNIPGVFAVGDVRTKPVRQIVTATADGAAAAFAAETWLSHR